MNVKPGGKLHLVRSFTLLVVAVCLVWLAYRLWHYIPVPAPATDGGSFMPEPEAPASGGSTGSTPSPGYHVAAIITATAGLISAIAGLLGAVTGLLAVRNKTRQQAAPAPTPPSA